MDQIFAGLTFFKFNFLETNLISTNVHYFVEMENLDNEVESKMRNRKNMNQFLGCYLIVMRKCGHFTKPMVNKKGFL